MRTLTFSKPVLLGMLVERELDALAEIESALERFGLVGGPAAGAPGE